MKRLIMTTVLVITQLVGLSVSAQDLTYAEQHVPEVFDPIYGGETFGEERINNLMHSGLYGVDKHGQPQYVLAAAFPLYSEQGQVLEIELRDDLKWSDGKAVTTDDITYSWRLLSAKMGDYLPFLHDIQSIKAKPGHPNTIIVRLKQPNPEMDFHNYLIFPLLPQHVIGGYDYSEHDDYAASPVTIGRYKIKDISGNNLDLEAHFWPHERQTSDHVRNIRIMQFNAIDQIFIYFSRRTTNFILDIPNANLNAVLSEPENFGARDYAANMWSGIVLNNTHKLLSHPEARIALTMLFDRESAIKNRFQRKASLITGPFTNGSSFYDIDVLPYEFDEEGAREIFETLGCTWDTDGKINFEGEPVKLRFMKNKATMTTNVDVVLGQFSKTMKQLGFDIEHNDLSNEKIFINKISYKRNDYDLAFINVKYPQDLGVYDIFHSKGGSNMAQYEDAMTDELMEQLLRATNDNVRIDLGKKVHQRIHEKAPFIFLWAHNYTAGYNVRRLDNIDIDPSTIFNSVTTWKAIQ